MTYDVAVVAANDDRDFYNTMCLAIGKAREMLELILVLVWLFSGKKSPDDGTTTADR